jgi:hypothetical protein
MIRSVLNPAVVKLWFGDVLYAFLNLLCCAGDCCSAVVCWDIMLLCKLCCAGIQYYVSLLLLFSCAVLGYYVVV